MKSNNMLLVICFLFASKCALACNSCSQLSVVSDNGLLLQNVLNDYVSLQARRAVFTSKLLENSQSNDQLFNYELVIKKSINNRIYVWAAVPYHRNHRFTAQESSISRNGLGDIRFGIDYKFKDLLPSKPVVLTPILTAGIKTPTGHYEHYILSQGMPRSFNPGTASWGALINQSFRLKYKQVGAALSASYFHQTKNKYGYRYGDQTNLTATVFYNFFADKTYQVLPMLGLVVDHFGLDHYRNGQADSYTGGRSKMAQIGCTLLKGQHIISAELRKPLAQTYAGKTVSLNNLCSIRYTYLFKNKKELQEQKKQ